MSIEKITAEQAVEQIILTLWGAGNKPNLEDLVSSVAGLQAANRGYAEERANMVKELDGLQRTLGIVNGAVDSLCELVGAKNTGELRPQIENLKRDSLFADRVIDIIKPIPAGQSPVSHLEAMRDRCRVLDETEKEGLAPKTVFLPVGLEMHTVNLICSFAENLGQRLNYKQRQGYVGWDRDDWRDDCLRRLHTSDKPLDVAAFAVFAWYHDWTGSYQGLTEFTPGTIENTNPPVHNTNITISVDTSAIADAVRVAIEAVTKLKASEDYAPGFRKEVCSHDSFSVTGHASRCNDCGQVLRTK